MSDETKEETKAEGAEETKPKAPEFKKPLVKMTVVELKEVAKEIPDAVGVTAMGKGELLSIIRKYYGLEDPSLKKKGKKDKASIKELKTKIVELRSKKAEVLETKDAKQINILRRRINRLKKQTRKAARN